MTRRALAVDGFPALPERVEPLTDIINLLAPQIVLDVAQKPSSADQRPPDVPR